MGDSNSSTPSKTDEWSGPKANKFEKYTMSPSQRGPWKSSRLMKAYSKAYSEYYDPCQEAADKSIRCLKRNGGERAMCTDFFQAYRDCKEQWQTARKEAKKNKSWFS